MSRKWDWIVTPDATRFMACYQTVARALPEMMRTWEVQAGELVVDLTGPGRVLMQTRSTDAFLSWLIPKLPTSSEGGKGMSIKLG